MSLIKVLADQAALNFTGRVNIMTTQTGEYLGMVSILEGKLIYAKYKGVVGRPALFHCLVDDLEVGDLKFMVEPEVVGSNESIFKMDYEDFVMIGQKIYQAYQSSKKFRPPKNLRLLINPDFISRGQDISYSEFEVLTVISDYNKVSDIYDNSQLKEYQVSNALVSLRTKGAIKVIGQ